MRAAYTWGTCETVIFSGVLCVLRTQVKPLVQAAFEAAARLNTRKCKFKQVR